MRRVALLVSSMEGGGAERVATTLAGAWADRGYESFLVPTYLGESRMAYPQHPAVKVSPLRNAAPASSTNMGQLKLRKLLALRQHISSIAPDIVVSFLTNVNICALIALGGAEIPVVISERTVPAGDIELPWALRVARRGLYQFADVLVVQTQEAAQDFRRCIFHPPMTVVIPNPLPRALHESATRASARSDGGEIVAMGRLTPSKRFDILMHAFARGFRDRGEWSLAIWGEGPLHGQLMELARGLNMEDRIRLCGRTADPWSVLAKAEMFAMSSAYEGFPNAMLEAMALGVPCVAFDCPSGTRELAFGGEAAVLVPNGRADLLAESLLALAEDPARRTQLGAFAADFVRERFSESLVTDSWERLFGRLA